MRSEDVARAFREDGGDPLAGPVPPERWWIEPPFDVRERADRGEIEDVNDPRDMHDEDDESSPRGWAAHLEPERDLTGPPQSRPYDLRHSFASLLLHESPSVIPVTRQRGHDARYTRGTYGHAVDELDAAAPRCRGCDPRRPRGSNLANASSGIP